VENLYIADLEPDRKKAMARLRVPPIGHTNDPSISIKVRLTH
jgi:hypothetical protein